MSDIQEALTEGRAGIDRLFPRLERGAAGLYGRTTCKGDAAAEAIDPGHPQTRPTSNGWAEAALHVVANGKPSRRLHR